jgi:hypothetical protein
MRKYFLIFHLTLMIEEGHDLHRIYRNINLPRTVEVTKAFR